VQERDPAAIVLQVVRDLARPVSFDEGGRVALRRKRSLEPFLNKWGPRTTTDLSRRITETIGGFPPKPLDQETDLNLTAYVLQVNGASAGSQPLTRSTAVEIRTITKGADSAPPR
jgi:hypothetical protein